MNGTRYFLGGPFTLDSKKTFSDPASLIDRDAKAFENWLVIHCQNTTPPLDERNGDLVILIIFFVIVGRNGVLL